MGTFDLEKCRDDFNFYATNLLKIKTEPPYPKIVPFNLRSSQVKLDKLFEQEMSIKGYVRINVLKARREGISTYVEGRIFHKVSTNPNTNAFIVAHDKDALSTIFDMSKLFYDCLPVDYRPMKRYSSKKELVFENPNDKSRFTEPGLRSKIEVFSANKVTASRSGGYSAAHFSEVAFYEDAETLLTATVPSIPDAPGTFIVRESTANGRGDFFHHEWGLAKEGKSNFKNIFFSWLEFEEYKIDLNDRQERDILNNLDEEEKVLRERYHAKPGQLGWRRQKLLDYHGDVDKFHQEYPTTDEEAFISSGTPYFSRNRIREYALKVAPPVFRGDITGYGLIDHPEGELKIWEYPQPGLEYVMGVDVGGGEEGGDHSVIEVICVPKGTPIVVQVAEWCGIIDPVILGEKCIRLAQLYNDALISPETNNHGLTTLNEIKEHYWNIYRWQYFDKFGKTYSQRLGWNTNVATRPLLCDYASAAINADIIVLRSEALVDELMSFIKRPGILYGGSADNGSFDDRVMAFLIALFTMAHSNQSSSLLRELGVLTMNPIIVPETKVILSAHDHDLPMIHSGQQHHEFYGNDRGWLNY